MANYESDYESDVVAWAKEQAALLRAGKFAYLDIEHIADEIESVGRACYVPLYLGSSGGVYLGIK